MVLIYFRNILQNLIDAVEELVLFKIIIGEAVGRSLLSRLFNRCGSTGHRLFNYRLFNISGISAHGIQLTESTGKAPKQLKEDDIMNLGGGTSDDLDLDSDFYGSDNYDEGDIDMEGFQDLSFEDGTMF